MSYALLSDDALLQAEAANVSRDARLLHIEGLVYCATALTDGLVSVRLARISDAPDPQAAADELVAAGLWSQVGNHYQIDDYLHHQPSASEVERRRSDARQRAERSRRHKRGDHSMCIKGRYCPDGAVIHSSQARHAHGAQDVHPPLLTDPLHSASEAKAEVEVEGASEETQPIASASALEARSASAMADVISPHIFVDRQLTDYCMVCDLPRSNRQHQRKVPEPLSRHAVQFAERGQPCVAEFLDDEWQLTVEHGGVRFEAYPITSGDRVGPVRVIHCQMFLSWDANRIGAERFSTWYAELDESFGKAVPDYYAHEFEANEDPDRRSFLMFEAKQTGTFDADLLTLFDLATDIAEGRCKP
jgi:hypothetical protein